MFATGSVPADTAKMFRVTQGMIGRKMTGLVSVCGTGEVARVAKSERGLRQTETIAIIESDILNKISQVIDKK